jgi:transcription termination/antitermination protein NusG
LKKEWFVFYTKSRQEKKVKDLLAKAGFDVFLPLHNVVRQWSDRKKKVEVPLFHSYIFVNESEYNIPSVLKIPGIAWNIKINGKPAVLREHELELIRRFISSGLFLETSALTRDTFKAGDKARIVDGPLAGIVGTVSGDPDQEKLNVLLEGIDQVIRVQIPAILLKKC